MDIQNEKLHALLIPIGQPLAHARTEGFIVADKVIINLKRRFLLPWCPAEILDLLPRGFCFFRKSSRSIASSYGAKEWCISSITCSIAIDVLMQWSGML